ncbi:hypothetical protein BMF94_6958 [Rhodotorula taiwanensis]|uniref:UBC core domain-containing protein n=1 Tax=Rhodotorula taiwanensis TaxID=741276 RepID=A0A2S5B034_9BASI|nr:hypothetical protein BMF94_6958 [Rhodotorula taiwanensis]
MANPARNKRLTREFQECQKDPKSGITILQVGDSLSHFTGSFPGPEGTSYEGGRFVVDIGTAPSLAFPAPQSQPKLTRHVRAIVAPPRYPFEPLQMKFITKANISSQTGFICLDILKSSWSPVFTLRTCLVSLQSLLSTPEPSDPQDAEVAKHYLTDREGFESTARYWTEVYAKPDPTSRTHTPSGGNGTGAGPAVAQEDDVEAKARLAGLDWADVRAFTEMGFPADQVVDTLRHLNYRGTNKREVGEDAVIQRLVG